MVAGDKARSFRIQSAQPVTEGPAEVEITPESAIKFGLVKARVEVRPIER